MSQNIQKTLQNSSPMEALLLTKIKTLETSNSELKQQLNHSLLG